MIYTLLPPTAPEVLSSIAPFDIDTFKKQEKISVTEFCNNMFETMKNYGGIGLSANQVGKPYRLFVMGDNVNINKGQKWVCINPEITNISKETIRYKEGCLTFPFLFLDIERPQKIKVKYLNEQLETVEEEFDGIVSRCYQHELDHMQGTVFT
jgi:peptide deformylase